MTESPEDCLSRSGIPKDSAPSPGARQCGLPAARHGPRAPGWFPALLLLGGLAAACRVDAGAAAPPSGACAADPGTPVPMRVRRVADVPFEWIVEDLELAITERNFRITGRNSLGKGLRERGHTGYPDFEIIHFCNLENARTVLDLDPGFVAQMPCRVTVHSEDKAVVVSMLLLPETHRDARVANFARAINVELCAIQDDAVIRR